MKEIQLTQGKVALVDDDDFKLLGQWIWCACKQKNIYYAIATSFANKPYGQKTCSSQMMHRIIMNAPKGMDVDHINHDGLDNRKENLRICTVSENGMNFIYSGKVLSVENDFIEIQDREGKVTLNIKNISKLVEVKI